VKKCAKTVHTKKSNQYISTGTVMVLLTWQHHFNHKTNHFSYFELVFAPLVMVVLTLHHHCNGGTNTVPPLGKGKPTLGTKILFPRFFLG
jgi:hypothetical protein